MNGSTIHSLPDAPEVRRAFRTAVSLHSHTLHSRESLSFVQKAAGRIPAVGFAFSRLARHHRKVYGTDIDMSRGWWTPPLGPSQAWLVEKRQVESALGMNALVSLSDHDNIDAPSHLRVLSETRDLPISVEWTVPYKETFFHLGIHNMPPALATRIMDTMRELTTSRCAEEITELIHELHCHPQVLIVFNHPLWDESGAGPTLHRLLAFEFFQKHAQFLHAFELNGLRPNRENRLVARWAQEAGVTLISGGDRHGREPNACLNLTNAATFAEFAAEIRNGLSHIVLMPHYAEPHGLRVTHNVYDILSHDAQHSLGWSRWSDRIFYHCTDGVTRSLTELWGVGGPTAVRFLVELIGLVGHSQIRGMLRASPREELL